MPRLVITRDGVIEAEVLLTSSGLRIGRDAENEVVLNDPDKGVSRFHAEIRALDGGYTVVDLGSRNGIWVHGQRVPSAALSPTTAVKIGSHELTIDAEPSSLNLEDAPTMLLPSRRTSSVRAEDPPTLQTRLQSPAPEMSWLGKRSTYLWAGAACALLIVAASVFAVVRSPAAEPVNVQQAESTPPTPPVLPPIPREEPSRTEAPETARVSEANQSPRLVPGIAPKPRETAEAYSSRASRLQRTLTDGRKSLDAGNFKAAIDTLSAIEREHQGAKKPLAEARQKLDAAVQLMQEQEKEDAAKAAAAARGAGSRAEAPAENRPATVSTEDRRVPTDVADLPTSLPKSKLLVIDGTKSKDRDVNVHLGAGQVAVLPKEGGAVLAAMRYTDLAHATYVRAKDPKWQPAAPGLPAGVELPGGLFGRGTRHWLVLQSKSACLVLSLDDSVWAQVISALEARTGLKVNRPPS